MTTTEKNNISTPTTGLMVYDTNINDVFAWTGSSWENFISAGGGMTSFIISDGGTSETITNGNTLIFAGTTNRLDAVVSATDTVTFDISASYVGQASITTLGTIATGVWQGTVIDAAYLDLADYLPLAGGSMTGNITYTNTTYGLDFQGLTGGGNDAHIKSRVGSTDGADLVHPIIMAQSSIGADTLTYFGWRNGTGKALISGTQDVLISVNGTEYLGVGSNNTFVYKTASIADITSASGAALISKEWAEAQYAPITAGGYLPLSGGTMTGDINMGGNNLTSSSMLYVYADSQTDNYVRLDQALVEAGQTSLSNSIKMSALGNGLVQVSWKDNSGFSTNLRVNNASQTNNIFLPDNGGTVALTSDLSSFGVGDVLAGTYTSGYIPRWNATTNTLESGLIRDDGTTLAVGTPAISSVLMKMNTSTMTFATAMINHLGAVNSSHAAYIQHQGATTTDKIALVGYAQAAATGSQVGIAGYAGTASSAPANVNIGVHGFGGNSVSTTYDSYGLYGNATKTAGHSGDTYGLVLSVSNGGSGTPYIGKFTDGTEGVGKVLTSDANGVATWQAQAGGGDVTKVGTPVDNQVGVWTGDGTIEGTSGFTYDGSVLSVTGQIQSVMASTVTQAADAATIDLNNGNSQWLDLQGATGAVTLTLSNPTSGTSYLIKIQQSTTSPQTVTWPVAVKWPGGTAPTISTGADAIDTVVLFYDGTNYYANFAQNYS
jgi:hypothetical protein